MKRLLQHAAIGLYLAATVSGFAYTMFRVTVPGMPRQLWIWSYGMMAPFQNYRTFNEELIAEGKMRSGEWERIDMMPYLPFVRGERAMRSYLVSFRYGGQGEALWRGKYAEYADMLWKMEAKDGKEWLAIRLSLERWPMSPAGYEYLRHSPFTEHTLLVQLPR